MSARGAVHDGLSTLRTALATRELRHLQAAWAATSLGNWAFYILLSIYAFEAGGAAGVGLAAVARMLPAGIAAPFTSLLADRGSRRDLLLRATLVRALALALAAAAVAVEAPFAIVVVVAAVQTVAESAVKPAQSALLPDLARTPEQLGAANAVLNGVENVGFLIGALAGGSSPPARASRPASRRPRSPCCSPPSRCAACRAMRLRRTARRRRVPGWRPRCWPASRWCCGSGAFGSWSAHSRWRPWSRARPTS